MGPAFFIPLAMSAIAGGAEYENQQSANSRQQGQEVNNIIQQQGYRNQANAGVNALTQQIAQSNPAGIAGQETNNYLQELRRNSAGAQTGGPTGDTQTFGMPVSANPTVGGFSSRYKNDVANDSQQVQNYGTTEANELGNIDAAVRQRQNEGLAMQSLGTNLNTLNTESWGTNFVNSLRAQAAGAQNPWVALGSQILSGAAQGASKNLPTSWGSTVPVNTDYMLDAAGTGNDTWGNPIQAGNPGYGPGGGGQVLA
jgi:hypothetical protein